MEDTSFTFVVEKIDFWNLLISDSSWAILGIIGYILIVYRGVILKSNIFSTLWKNKGLIGYAFAITTLVAIVYQSFPAITEFMQSMPFYNETMGKLGFVGIGAAAMRFTNGENKKQLIKDIFKKEHGFDPDAIIIKND